MASNNFLHTVRSQSHSSSNKMKAMSSGMWGKAQDKPKGKIILDELDDIDVDAYDIALRAAEEGELPYV